MTYTDKITLKRESSIERERLNDSTIAYDYAKKIWNDGIDLYESAMIILLDCKNNTIGWSLISQGGVTRTVVDNRIICKIAIETLASSVILVHNHPSGVLKPSRADDNLTNSVKQGLNLFGIELIDHLIISKQNYYSYQEEGRL